MNWRRVRSKKGFPGAKMTGGGAGGVVAILGRSGDRFAIRSIAEEYGTGHGTVPYIFEGTSGVDAFGVRTLQLSRTPGMLSVTFCLASLRFNPNFPENSRHLQEAKSAFFQVV